MKKRHFNFKAQSNLVGVDHFMSNAEAAKVRALMRRDIKEFKMGVAEIADLCKMNHVFPYELFPSNQALADQVIDELQRQHDASLAVNERVR